MTDREIVETWTFADMPPVGGERDQIVDIAKTIGRAEQHAFQTLINERAIDLDDPELPPTVIADETGRAITGIRLEREAGTPRFTIVLVTATPQEAS